MKIVQKTNYSGSELQEFETVILNKMAEAKEELDNFKAQLADNTEDRPSSIDGAITSEKEYITAQANRLQKFIDQLAAALVRIKNKTYGICVKTGKLIPRERLLAVPHTTVCIEAKVAA